MSGGEAVAGEANGRSKLVAFEVLGIRYKYGNGAKVMALAEEYGVTEGTIRMIVTRRTWKHI